MPKDTTAATAARRGHRTAEPTRPVPVRLSASMIGRLEAYRLAAGLPDRAAATRDLIERGLASWSLEQAVAETTRSPAVVATGGWAGATDTNWLERPGQRDRDGIRG